MVRVDAMLALASKSSVSEMVVIEALVSTIFSPIENCEGRRGKRAMCTSLGTKQVAALPDL